MSAPRLTQEARARLEAVAALEVDGECVLNGERFVFSESATWGDLRALLSELERMEAMAMTAERDYAVRVQAERERDEARDIAEWRKSILLTLLRQTSNGDVRGKCERADSPERCLHIWCRVIRDAELATSAPDQRESEGGA